jgi:hypothetical protein
VSDSLTTVVSGGFNSSVALSIGGLPAGVTASFSPATIPAPGSGSAVLTLTVSSSTPAGTYPLTVTASGGGLASSVSLSLGVTAAGSTVSLFSDGFEGNGWSAQQLAGTSGKWTLTASGRYPRAYPHSGATLADFNSHKAASGSQTRIYRPAGIAIPSTYSTATLSFWIYHDTGYSTGNDQLQPQISTDGATWATIGPAVSRYNGTTGWAQVTLDLSAYRGKTVYLGFVGIGGHGNDIYLDDVAITAR